MQATSTPFAVSAPGKRICFWGAKATAALDPPDLDAQLAESGANSGNVFIGAGLFRNTECAEKSYHPGFAGIPPEELDERYDAMFIPASNFVSRSVDLASAHAYLARTRMPLICFGLGSQFLPSEEVRLEPGTRRFLDLVSERSGSIGVRGAFTAQVMHDMGIRNLSLTGCPSLMSLGAKAIEGLRHRRPQTLKVGLSFSNNVRRHALAPAALAATENALFRRMLFENSYYVLQNEQSEMTALEGKPGNEVQTRNAVATVASLFDVKDDLDQAVAKYLSHRLRMFFDPDAWVAAMGTMTAAVGTRFHGNVAAVLAGTPALFLAHDMRTKELCDLFRLPSLTVDKPYGADEVLERLLSVDYGPFLGHLPYVQAEWTLFLARNGFPQPRQGGSPG